MNLLIVDDDFYVVESLKSRVNWNSIGIENVYTSYNVKKAKNILSSELIHVILCDIEMPKENGLELLKWIREKNMISELIFLTSYSEFEYASTAVNLQAFNYLLKPIENEKLLSIVEKAIEKVKDKVYSKEHKIGYEKWSESLKTRKDFFWSKTLIDSVFQNKEDYQNYLCSEDLPYKINNLYKFIYIEIIDFKEVYDDLGKGMFNYNYKNIVESFFLSKEISLEGSVRKNISTYIFIFANHDFSEFSTMELIKKIENNFKCQCFCFLSNQISLYNINQEYYKIINFRPTITFGTKNVLYPKDLKTEVTIHSPPNLYLWETLIIDGKKNDILKLIDEYFLQFKGRAFINKNIISQFLVNFLRIIDNLMKKKKPLTDSEFFKKDRFEFFNESTLSLENTIYYSKSIVKHVIDVMQQENESKSTIDIIKDYIKDNIDKEITRDVLAKQVFLNVDYLSKLFKKETNISLGSYITSERIKLAKEYLKNTNEQIYSVALKVGYDNFSYFSRIFKEATGFTPKQYKNKNSNK